MKVTRRKTCHELPPPALLAHTVTDYSRSQKLSHPPGLGRDQRMAEARLGRAQWVCGRPTQIRAAATQLAFRASNLKQRACPPLPQGSPGPPARPWGETLLLVASCCDPLSARPLPAPRASTREALLSSCPSDRWESSLPGLHFLDVCRGPVFLAVPGARPRPVSPPCGRLPSCAWRAPPPVGSGFSCLRWPPPRLPCPLMPQLRL